MGRSPPHPSASPTPPISGLAISTSGFRSRVPGRWFRVSGSVRVPGSSVPIQMSEPDSTDSRFVSRVSCFRLPISGFPHPASGFAHRDPKFISRKVLMKSFCKSQFSYKSVNIFFVITNIKNKLTDLCGIDFCRTLQKHFP